MSIPEPSAQLLEKPHSRPLPIPKELRLLHPKAAALLEAIKVAEPKVGSLEDDPRVCVEQRSFPYVLVTKERAGKAARAFHVILTAMEERGIQFVESGKKGKAGHFTDGKNEEGSQALTIEETIVQKPSGQPRWDGTHDERKLKIRKPSGRLRIHIETKSSALGSWHGWTEYHNVTLEELLFRIVDTMRRHFLELATDRSEEEAQRRRKEAEDDRRRRAWQKEFHKESIEKAVRGRVGDMLKAAAWWRMHRDTVDFIEASEQRWRLGQSGEITQEQRQWLTWARDTAKALSPFELGYPDPAKDGAFEASKIPLDGPFPPLRNFPHPPTMPELPPMFGHSSASKPYPFWLLHQR